MADGEKPVTVDDPVEIALIERFRDCLRKARETRSLVRADLPVELTRSSSHPDPMDSDDVINYSVAVRICSERPSMSSYDVALEKSLRS